MSNQNLFVALRDAFPADLDRTAVETDDGLRYSWRDLDRATAMLANLLDSLDLPPLSRIAVQVEKSVEAMVLYLATLRAGHVFLPLNTAYQSGEIVTLGDDRTGSLLERAVHYSDRHTPALRRDEDLAAILYTSGTTGRSKGAMLTHGNMRSNALTLRTYWQWQPDDVLIHALPIFHVHGLFVAIHGALINGSKMIWLSKFDPKVVIAKFPEATVFMGVPTLYVRMLAEPTLTAAQAAHMRLFIAGSAPLLMETFTEWQARTGHTILERYGMSETVMLTSNPCGADARFGGATERHGGTVGFPLPGVALRVVGDDGQPVPAGEIGGIQVQGPNVFKGYWRMPEKTAEEFTADGFFKTGDVGKVGADGYVTIVGRSK
nr:AMP-binding protein [Hydrogenophaga sp.]